MKLFWKGQEWEPLRCDDCGATFGVDIEEEYQIELAIEGLWSHACCIFTEED